MFWGSPIRLTAHPTANQLWWYSTKGGESASQKTSVIYNDLCLERYPIKHATWAGVREVFDTSECLKSVNPLCLRPLIVKNISLSFAVRVSIEDSENEKGVMNREPEVYRWDVEQADGHRVGACTM